MDTLSFEKITAAYKKGKNTKLILQDVSICLNPGEFVCLCGPNGCGKSTLLSILSGIPNKNLQIVSAQKLPSLNQTPLHKIKRMECAKKISYMQQNEFSMWDFSVFDFVLQGRFCHSDGGHYSSEDFAIVNKILEEMNLLDFSSRNVNALSGGEFQKIRIARALCQKPEFMLLDEPASNLDYVYEPKLMQMLRSIAHEKKISILAIVHNINLACCFADKICLLPPKHSIISGKPDEIMTPENLKLTFGVDFQCKETKLFQSSL